jgi:hypothetical protein
MRALLSSWGHRTGRKESTVFLSIVSINFKYSGFVEAVGCVGVGGNRNSFPTEVVNATISTP